MQRSSSESTPTIETSSWHDAAMCKGRTDLFFPDTGKPTASAFALCSVCPSIEPCAAAGKGQVGLWGGKYRSMRQVVIVGRRRQNRAVCGTDSGYHKHKRDRTPYCDECTEAHAVAEAVRSRQRADRRHPQSLVAVPERRA